MKEENKEKRNIHITARITEKHSEKMKHLCSTYAMNKARLIEYMVDKLYEEDEKSTIKDDEAWYYEPVDYDPFDL